MDKIIIGEFIKKIFSLHNGVYIFIILGFLFLVYKKRQLVKKYLRTLICIRFLANLRQENMDNLKNYIKIELSFVRADAYTDELKIAYNIFNFSIFDIKLSKFIEKKVELSSRNALELQTGEYKEYITIQKQTDVRIEVKRKLRPNEIDEINRIIKECKEKDGSSIINILIYFYIECKSTQEPITNTLRLPSRIPHYELLNLQSTNTAKG